MSIRSRFLVALCACALAAPTEFYGQSPERTWRVGVLAPSLQPEIYEALAQGLGDLGYVEGRNLQIEWRIAEGRYERLEDLARELVRLKVDVLVTEANPGTMAALKATSAIPIVFVAGDPVGSGIVRSLARPGGNATGISNLIAETTVKQIEMLISVVPGLSRVAVLLNPANPGHRRRFKSLEAAVPRDGKVSLIAVDAQTEQEIRNAFISMKAEGTGAFLYIEDPFLSHQLKQIAQQAARYGLPSIAAVPAYADAGGLMSYGPNRQRTFRHLATYVDKILKGANPADLPVEQPTKLDLIINRKTAKALGLTIPRELLVLADRVIE